MSHKCRAETKTIFEDYAELCTANESIGLLVINRKVRYNEFLELCNYVDGELPVVTSAQATNAQRAFLRDKLTQDQDLGNCIINRDERKSKEAYLVCFWWLKTFFLFACEVGYWSAQTRDPVTKDWINPYNNSVLGKWPFPGFDGDDDLLTEDFNCLRVWGANIKIAKCMSEGACGFCFLKQKNQTLTLKGIRDEDVYDNNEFDREYYPFGYRNQHIIFQ